MLRRVLLQVLLLGGIGANVAFLLINLSPQRPHLRKPRTVKLLLRASPARAEWMRQNLLAEFGAANDVRFELVLAKTFDEVERKLLEERDHPSGLLLADLNDELADDARAAHVVKPIVQGAPPEDLAQVSSDYLPEALARATVDHQLWFIPKRALLDVAIYQRPAVEDLYLHWEKDRPAIEAALREANGVGLPRRYQLEKLPDQWDCFDLFVAGWYWAHHPAPWAADPTPQPRLALRTGLNEDALDDLFSELYRHGFEDKMVGHFTAQPVVDVLQWRALFRRHHLLVREAEDPKGIDAFPVNAMFKERRIAWAPIDQADSLWVHGGSRRDAEPGMAGAADLDWATLPTGNSVELDARGEPARAGRSVSLEEVHLWALPVHAPDARLAWELARFVTQRGLHQREAEAQGLLPIRADIADAYPVLFRLEWMQRMLDASYRQLQRGAADIPDQVADQHLDQAYVQLVESVVSRNPPPVTPAAVRAAIEAATQGNHAPR